MTIERTAARAAWLMAVLLPVAFGLAATMLGMDANWDLRNYHLYNGFAWVEDRYGTDLFAAQRPAFYNPTLDIPLWLAADRLPARAVGALLGLLQGLNATLLLALGWVALAPLAPWPRLGLAALAAVVGMTGATGWGLLGTTFGDNIVSVLVLAAWLVLAHRHDALVSGPAGAALVRALAAGLLAGAAAGLKQPAAIWGFGNQVAARHDRRGGGHPAQGLARRYRPCGARGRASATRGHRAVGGGGPGAASRRHDPAHRHRRRRDQPYRPCARRSRPHGDRRPHRALAHLAAAP